MEQNYFFTEMIRSELEDAVGKENVDYSVAGRLIHGVDCFWLSLMNVATSQTPPMPDCVVRPGSDEEVMKVLKIADYYDHVHDKPHGRSLHMRKQSTNLTTERL